MKFFLETSPILTYLEAGAALHLYLSDIDQKMRYLLVQEKKIE